MSQLVAPSHTMVDSIPLGRRISEIMVEKGAAYTVSAMAKRLDINRETFRLMLKGDREIYTFELDKIATDLKLTVERILQSDIVELRKQVYDLLTFSNSNIQYGMELAEQLAAVAIGYTEKAMATNFIGTAYYQLLDFDRALEVYEAALPDARIILDKYGDASVFLFLSGNIISTRTVKKDYPGVQDILMQVESYFHHDPRSMGIVYYNWAMLLEDWKGDIEGAREKHYQSLNYYIQFGNPLSIGRAKHHIATFEYRQQQYEKAEALFKSALEIFRQQKHLYMRIIIGRDYGRVLLRLQRYQDAAEVIEESLGQLVEGEFTDVAAQLYLLYAEAKQDPQYAEQIIAEQLGSISIQKLAGKFVVEYFEQQGDAGAHSAAQERLNEMRESPIELLLPIKSKTPGYLLTLLDLCIKHNWHFVE
ncbi:MAG: tetratricopeptide repeat protein [Tumebacillaceae bacterium]